MAEQTRNTSGEGQIEANLLPDKKNQVKVLENMTKEKDNLSKDEKNGIEKDENETPEDVKKLLEEVEKQIKTQEEKIPMTEYDMQNFVDWCLTNNRFLGYDDKNDLKGTDSTDKMANQLSSWVFSRLAGTGVGMALISTGVLAWLGILIIIYANIPNQLSTNLKKYLTEKTFDIIPFDKIPNINEKLAGYADGTKKRVEGKLNDLKKSHENALAVLKERKANLEKKLKESDAKDKKQNQVKQSTDEKGNEVKQLPKASGQVKNVDGLPLASCKSDTKDQNHAKKSEVDGLKERRSRDSSTGKGGRQHLG